MLPTLAPGDHVFVDPGAELAVGDLVVARHPYVSGQNLVKRVGALSAEGVRLISDNPGEATDSRTLGVLPRDHVLGKVVARVR